MTFTTVNAGIGSAEISSISRRWRNINTSMPTLNEPVLLLSSMPSAGVDGLGTRRRQSKQLEERRNMSNHARQQSMASEKVWRR